MPKPPKSGWKRLKSWEEGFEVLPALPYGEVLAYKPTPKGCWIRYIPEGSVNVIEKWFHK